MLSKFLRCNSCLFFSKFVNIKIQLIISFVVCSCVFFTKIVLGEKRFKLNSDNEKSSLDYFATNNILIENLGTNIGISAMSISDMTKIPRATIIRKCKYLIKEDLIKLNEKKQYVLTSMNFRKILPYQTEIFKYKAKFIRKVLNLLVIS